MFIKGLYTVKMTKGFNRELQIKTAEEAICSAGGKQYPVDLGINLLPEDAGTDSK
jgi:hypothetical protein